MYWTTAYTMKMSAAGVQYIAASLALRIAGESGGDGSGAAWDAVTPYVAMTSAMRSSSGGNCT